MAVPGRREVRKNETSFCFSCFPATGYAITTRNDFLGLTTSGKSLLSQRRLAD
jgi:hypothetical protein